MSTPFNIQGYLNLPGSPGLPADPIPFGILSQYDSKEVSEFTFPPSPSGIQVVNFGTIPGVGVKAYVLIYLGTAIPPAVSPSIFVTRNGGTQPEEVTPGGFLAGGNPNPTGGIASMSIAYTGAGKVQLWLLG